MQINNPSADGANKILVTGGAGYIGAHTVHALLESGFEPVVLDTLENGHASFVPDDVAFYEGNINDARLISQIHKEQGFSKVIHFAAYIEAGESMKDPLKFFQNNTSTSILFLKTLEELEVKQVVFSSTAAVYGTPQTVPISEDHPLLPINYYGASKLMVEQVLESCEQAYGWDTIRLRYFNAAGAGFGIGEQHNPETHLIPIMLEAAMGKREKVLLYGTDYNTPDGTCVRDYIHVVDLANAHICALKALDAGTTGVFNVGVGRGYSVREIVETCKDVTEIDFAVEEVERRPGDPDDLVADTTKIRQTLGWEPQYGLREIVEHAWQWHRTK